MKEPKKKKSVLLLRLEMPRWPLEESAFKSFFKLPKNNKDGFDPGAFAERLAEIVSKFLRNQLEKPLRKKGAQGKSTTLHTVAAMSITAPTCWYDHTTWEVLVDENGDPFIRECQHYECDDGTSYMCCEDYPA